MKKKSTSIRTGLVPLALLTLALSAPSAFAQGNPNPPPMSGTIGSSNSSSSAPQVSPMALQIDYNTQTVRVYFRAVLNPSTTGGQHPHILQYDSGFKTRLATWANGSGNIELVSSTAMPARSGATLSRANLHRQGQTRSTSTLRLRRLSGSGLATSYPATNAASNATQVNQRAALATAWVHAIATTESVNGSVTGVGPHTQTIPVVELRGTSIEGWRGAQFANNWRIVEYPNAATPCVALEFEMVRLGNGINSQDLHRLRTNASLQTIDARLVAQEAARARDSERRREAEAERARALTQAQQERRQLGARLDGLSSRINSADAVSSGRQYLGNAVVVVTPPASTPRASSSGGR